MKKYCIECKLTKSVTDFYVRSGNDNPTEEGHYTSYCKTCYGARSKSQIKLPRYQTSVPSEHDAIQYFARHGILATTGKVSAYPDVDVVAGMGVCVEVKFSRETGSGNFIFNTTPVQMKRGILGHVVMLICEWRRDTHQTYHLFNASEPFFYIDGRVKAGITYVKGREVPVRDVKHSPILTESAMMVAQDRTDLIWEWTERISDIIRTQGIEAVRPPRRGNFDKRIQKMVMNDTP